MFIRVYPISCDEGYYSPYFDYSEYYIERPLKSKVINTSHIMEISIECKNPRMDLSNKKIFEKIFDKKIENLVIYHIKFSDNTEELIIGPKDKYDNIK